MPDMLPILHGQGCLLNSEYLALGNDHNERMLHLVEAIKWETDSLYFTWMLTKYFAYTHSYLLMC